MRVEDVLAALVAHSQKVNFSAPDPLVKQASKRKRGKAKPDNWREVRGDDGKIDHEESWPAIRTALGRGTMGIPSGSITEATSDAFSGMPARWLKTLQIAVGINPPARKAIESRLMTLAERSKKTEQSWPRTVARKRCYCGHRLADDYLPDLVELVILELEHPSVYRTHKERAEWFGMPESSWYLFMRRPHDELSQHLWSWYHKGIGYIQSRLARRRETA